MNKFFLLSVIICTSTNNYALSTIEQTTTDSTHQLETVIINSNSMLGNKFLTKLKAGSAYYISPEELKQFHYSDINRILNKVPGVNIYEEDGFGLRPNISLRGTSPERTSKITIMEDGVLIAPAPYSAPAAYYFPNAQRMVAIEILKGSSQVQYGPFTTGGAINMLSTPITNKKFSGNVRANYGSFNTFNAHTHISQNFGQIAYSIEGLKYSSSGFKKLMNDNNANTGFDRNELIGKIKFSTKPKDKYFQSLELKMAYNNENANETYLGLTRQDFNDNPYMRYAASQRDNITTSHKQLMATHTIDFTSSMRLTTTGYYNEFKRNWYKLDGIRLNNEKIGINKILTSPSDYPIAMSIFNGSNSVNDALELKHNNRKYGAKGVQTKFDYHFTTNSNVHHDIEVGLRYHEDYEDRLQQVDKYKMDNNSLVMTTLGRKGTDANKITSARALSAFAMYKVMVGKWMVSPGLRMESISLTSRDYGKADSNRAGTSIKQLSNDFTVLIPGLSSSYKINDNWIAFAGVHKGFAPAGVDSLQLPESSVNIEFGSRFERKSLYVEAVYYMNKYSNLLGSDLAATGGGGTLDLFNAGKSSVNGIEFIASYNILEESGSKFILPIDISYTYTDAKFKSEFTSKEELWGVVNINDEMPYIAKHQLHFGLGLAYKKLSLRVHNKYSSGFRTKAGNGDFDTDFSVPSYLITDFSARYNMTDNIALTANVNNLLNKKYLVSLAPSGLRPGMPMSVLLGIDIKL